MFTSKRTISCRVGRAWRGKLLILHRMTLTMWMGYWHWQQKKLCKGTYHLTFRRCCFSSHTSQRICFHGKQESYFLHEKSVFFFITFTSIGTIYSLENVVTGIKQMITHPLMLNVCSLRKHMFFTISFSFI